MVLGIPLIKGGISKIIRTLGQIWLLGFLFQTRPPPEYPRLIPPFYLSNILGHMLQYEGSGKFTFLGWFGKNL